MPYYIPVIKTPLSVTSAFDKLAVFAKPPLLTTGLGPDYTVRASGLRKVVFDAQDQQEADTLLYLDNFRYLAFSRASFSDDRPFARMIENHEVVWGNPFPRLESNLEDDAAKFFMDGEQNIYYRSGSNVVERIDPTDGSTMWTVSGHFRRPTRDGLYHVESDGGGNSLVFIDSDNNTVSDTPYPTTGFFSAGNPSPARVLAPDRIIFTKAGELAICNHNLTVVATQEYITLSVTNERGETLIEYEDINEDVVWGVLDRDGNLRTETEFNGDEPITNPQYYLGDILYENVASSVTVTIDGRVIENVPSAAWGRWRNMRDGTIMYNRHRLNLELVGDITGMTDQEVIDEILLRDQVLPLSEPYRGTTWITSGDAQGTALKDRVVTILEVNLLAKERADQEFEPNNQGFEGEPQLAWLTHFHRNVFTGDVAAFVFPPHELMEPV